MPPPTSPTSPAATAAPIPRSPPTPDVVRRIVGNPVLRCTLCSFLSFDFTDTGAYKPRKSPVCAQKLFASNEMRRTEQQAIPLSYERHPVS